LSGAIYQIADGQFLVDETGGQVVVNPRRLGLQAQAQVTSRILASAAVSQADALVNLITQVQTATEDPEIQTLSQAKGLGVPIPGDGSDAGNGTNSSDAAGYTLPDYGTNLWIAQIAITSGYLTAIATNTEADILYEIQSRTNLLQTDWQSEGFINGSELTNWTPLNVWQGSRANFFIRLRSWIDSDDLGIPDWWQLEYFGTIGIDPYASAAGDGYSNLQKFQMRLNPTNYYNPNMPGGFFGSLDASGTNAIIYWNSMPGAVNYLVQRGVLNLNGNYAYTQFLVSSNANWFEDVGAITSANAQNDIYTLQAVFPGGSLSGTNTWQVSWYAYFSYGPPYGPPLPGDVYANVDATGTNVLVTWTLAQGAAINYLVERGTNTGSYSYVYAPIAQTGTNVTSYEDVGALTNASNWVEAYAVAAVYPGGGLSCPAPSYSWYSSIPICLGSSTNGTAAPADFWGYTDWIDYPWEGGTNVFLTWTASPGAVAYILYAGNWDNSIDFVRYQPIGRVSTTSFELAGGTDGNGNFTYSIFAIVAVYADGSLSQSALWHPGNDAPPPGTLAAYVDATGTNVDLIWSPVSGATGYSVQRSDYNNEFYEIAETDSGTTAYVDADEVDNANLYGSGIDAVSYQVVAFLPNGGYSAGVTAGVSSTPPAPTGLTATVDTTGKNVLLAWSPAVGAVTGYVIERGTYNPATGTYSYSQIGTVGSGTTSFEDAGAITSGNANNNIYRVTANFSGGQLSAPVSSSVNQPSAPPTYNLNVTAQMVRNQTGHWQLMFSSIPTNVQTIAFYWYEWDYFYDIGPFSDTVDLINGTPFTTENDIPVSSLTNGVYVIPDFLTTNWFPNNAFGKVAMIQPIGTNNQYGTLAQVGFQPYDSPIFVDGRQHMKQNLLYQLRSATISQPNAALTENDVWDDPFFENIGIPVDTNYVESSLFHYSRMVKGYNDALPTYVKMDDVWPITVNYELHQNLYDPNYTGTNFVWQSQGGYYGYNLSFQGMLATIPAPAVLGIGDPYWISQNLNDPGDVGASTNGGMFALSGSAVNLFGLPFAPALVNQGSSYLYWDGTKNVEGHTPIITVAPNNSTALTNVNCLFSQTADPDLRLTDYYFAPVNTPGTALVGGSSPSQAYPLPCLTGFANTNKTGLMIASVGNPTVIGGWAKFSIHNGSAGKFAYLGQYFVTNAFLLDTNGNLTTNTMGVVSPYGDFFPTEPGTVAMVTMPDIDQSYEQGIGVVRVIALNADANHDGTMDFTYNGPDFVSASKPMRFWCANDNNVGDYGGDGVPGELSGFKSDAGFFNQGAPYRTVQGRRDLEDFFPVYLNIGSLFQSNALSAGINPSDTSWKFILSQSDGALGFVYTTLTPTNYMNYLRDTNLSETLGAAEMYHLYGDGSLYIGFLGSLGGYFGNGQQLDQQFLNSIATNNGGIILVEAINNTVAPLVLTIYHGTNQIATTSLPLSITGIEQMFRSKTIMLNPEPGTVADRLTDASVPNEPDTTDRNFIFLHGYNVNPNQARGWDADFYKRMYWSGSHAKFWGVTWEAADTQVAGEVTINLQTNIVNAFNTAPLLNDFLNSLSGTNIVAAHSLGNMVVLSALNDYTNQSINTYFMIDAAVPMEALEGYQGQTGSMLAEMIHSEWMPYANKLYASDWRQLFPTSDARSALTWSNRLSNFQNASVYNFYSSGEEVLRATTSDPPTNLVSAVKTIVYDYFVNNPPAASYMWVWQEKGKGRCASDGLLSSSHGGWKFNSAYDTNGAHLGVSQASSLSNVQLSTNAFFDVTSTSFGNVDLALYGSGGSAYAQTHSNRILSDAIPSLTLPVGANAVTTLDEPGNTHNFDMTAQLENGWPSSRMQTAELNNWHHSDCRQIAYTFTCQLFDKIATLGNLK
jgi:hypothetical protein